MADNTILNAGTGGDVVATDDIGGVKFQRIKLVHGADGTNAGDVSTANPLPVQLMDTDRTQIMLFASGAAAASNGVDTLVTLTRSGAPGAATTSASSFTVTSGKRFRITSITFASRGHATATAQSTTYSLRVNTAGAATASSNILLSARTATPATASAWDRMSIPLPPDGIEIPGDGTLQFGLSALSAYTTNAPTLDVLMTGYEY